MTKDAGEFVICDPRYAWLSGCLDGWQFGEQGILARLMVNTQAEEGPVVEIGGGDGGELPLTVERFVGQRPVIVYEKDEQCRDSLRAKFGDRIDIHGAYRENTFGDASLVVIDVDGCDCLVMVDVLETSRPKVIMVEHYDRQGFTSCQHQTSHCPPAWLLGMPLYSHIVIQAHYDCLDRIANEHGYSPVCRTRVNSIYMRAEL